MVHATRQLASFALFDVNRPFLVWPHTGLLAVSGSSIIRILKKNSCAMSPVASPLILRSLFRSLWRATKPFTRPSPTAIQFNCLLDRTGKEDECVWLGRRGDEIEAISGGIPSQTSTPRVDSRVSVKDVFRRLLREVINSDASGTLQMRFPSHFLVGGDRHYDKDKDPCGTLRRILLREYRTGSDAICTELDPNGRQELAFFALRKLNAKLAWLEELQKKAKETEKTSGKPPALPSVKDVFLLPTEPAASYLQPGTFLIAHPNLTGYFRRTIICILDHSHAARPGQSTGTYGLIINRPCSTEGNVITLSDALDPLPDDIEDAFGDQNVRDGGPVHAVLQMLHRPSESERELDIKGNFLNVHPFAPANVENIPIKYQGDITTASNAVMSGHAMASDFSFIVGASCWALGQLESEVQRGYWIPCCAPVSLALDPCDDGDMDELYVQILAACGRHEADLAELIRYDDREDHPFRVASDDF
jgi:putative AlgH/UPF0301 family transcriptional regulator